MLPSIRFSNQHPTIYLVALLCYLPFLTFGQLSDDFEDGDLANPTWLGETSLFKVENGELQLFNTAPESANTTTLYLDAPTAINNVTTWEFKVRMAFDPSGGNNCQVFLNANNPDLLGDQNAYLIQIGEGGSDDALELVRQDGASTTTLITGTVGAVAMDPNVSVRVTRDASGNWELLADYAGGTSYASEGIALDATYDLGQYFGFVCTYSSSRAEDFFFDDVLIDPIYADTDAPQLLSAASLDANTVELCFNEPIDQTTAENIANYDIISLGAPASAMLNSTNPSKVILTYGTDFEDGTSYVVSSSNIADLNGNTSGEQVTSFDFVLLAAAQAMDVIINEIMADPNPVVLLPDAEYVELYNRSNQAIDLAGWIFDSGSAAVLPSYILEPDAYVFLVDSEFATQFQSFNNVIVLGTLPALSNNGDGLSLTSADGTLINEVNYSITWYQNSSKDDGGYSLELINPLDACAGETNWRASNSSTGGTPGKPNSVLNLQGVDNRLMITGVFPNDPSELKVTFEKAFDRNAAENTSNYSIDNGINILSATAISQKEVLLTVSPFFEEQVVYTLTLAATAKDCLGNEVGEAISVAFGLTEPIGVGDLIINEILANPETGGSDFIELYNTTDKIFNLGEVVVGSNDDEGELFVKTLEDFLILPKAFVVVTPNRLDVLAKYDVANPNNLIENSLPTLADKDDDLIIYTTDEFGASLTLDSLYYNDALHNTLLDDKNGVSLERVSFVSPTLDANNWQSAAKSAGYATPTAQNSQYFENGTATVDTKFTLPYESFAPLGGAENMFLTIDYKLDMPGYLANIRIYDANGRLVNMLVNNEILANEGFFVWDGNADYGGVARMGIYIVWIELVHPNGDVEYIKETCVLAKEF